MKMIILKGIVDKLMKNGIETINYGTGESGLIEIYCDGTLI